MVAEDGTSDSDMSTENDVLEMFLLDTLAPKKDLGTLLNFQDISEESFENLFG